MTEQILTSPAEFSHTILPVVGKTVLRMGVAGSYGIDSADIRWAAGQGANYWVWGRGFSACKSRMLVKIFVKNSIK